MRSTSVLRAESCEDGMHCLSIGLWLAGASVTAIWIHGGGGYEWPLTFFATWAWAVCLMYMIALAPGRTSGDRFRATLRDVARAIQYGFLSVLVYLAGMVLFAFWPVTVTMGFLFALCRFATASDPRSAAY